MFLIVRKSDDLLTARESTEYAADMYSTEIYDIVHWNLDVSGSPPPLNEVLVDSREYSEKRRCGFRCVSDAYHVEYRGCIAEGDDEAPSLALWQTPRKAIKDKYLKNWAACTADNSTDYITDTDHGFNNDDLVEFTADTIPTGLSEDTIYWVINKTANTFQVSTTEGGDAINFTTDGAAVTYRERYVIS